MVTNVAEKCRNFIAQYKVNKSQFRNKSKRNVPFVVETENKPSFQCRPLDFELNVCVQTSSSKIGPWSPYHGSVKPNFIPRKSLD